MKRVSILGSTGSIGTSAVKILGPLQDQFPIVALAARSNVDLLADQVRSLRPRLVSVGTAEAVRDLRSRLNGFPVEVVSGEEGLVQVATHPEADCVLSALVGAAGLLPTLAAIRAGKNVALANKETLVMAGELMISEAAARGVTLLPVDSEHSAIFQCLSGARRGQVKRLILTASGGPFRTRPRESFAEITVEEALRHPTWVMGKKITIDSATLMNKGLEVVEAHWLFDLPVSQIDVLIHPQSIVHSMVEFVDGSILAQLSVTDMRLPILYALTHPERAPVDLPRLNLAEVPPLAFEPVDRQKFPCLSYAYEAADAGGTFPIALNAANEMAVELFLARRIGFAEIPVLIRWTLDSHRGTKVGCLEDVLTADRDVRGQIAARYGVPRA